ncbi:MAG TPA: lytic transglycosylase domain-containing protein [Acetobacteraceae bacterium]|nr:lytic transglycosylase domain-containing protein [Acetobacteraceae bacterium]
MRRGLLVASAIVATFAARPTLAADDARNQATIRGCILAAADAYREPPAVLVVLLDVEDGSLGAVSRNTNGTVDIGPMQVNQVWLPDVAGHWHTTERAAFLALRDNFCANMEAGAWILRQGLDRAGGDFWEGVGTYHSHDPRYKRAYLRAVFAQVTRLRALAERASHQATPQAPPPLIRTAQAGGSG